jgi:O-antigen ligase
MVNLKSISLILISIIPNAYLLKSMFYQLPDLTLILYICLYLLFIVYFLINRDFRFSFSKFDLYISLFVTILLFSVLISPNQLDGLFKLMKFVVLGLGIVYLTKVYVKDQYDYNFLLKSYLYSSLIIELIVIYEFIQQGMPFGRFSFYGAHPIPLGMMGAITAIVAVTFYVNKRLSVFLLLLSLIISSWIVLISSSKGPLLTMLIVIVLLLPSIFNSIKRFAVMISVGLVTFNFVSKTDQYKMMVDRILGVSSDQSTFERLNHYNQALDVFKNNPVIGGGIGVFSDVGYPHNVVLEVLGQGGVFLGVLLIGFLIWLIVKYVYYLTKHRYNFEYTASIMILLASIIVLMVSYTYVDLKFLYLGLGLLLAQSDMLQTVGNPEFVKQKKKRLKRYKIVW